MNQAKNPECQAGRVDIAVEQCANDTDFLKYEIDLNIHYYHSDTGGHTCDADCGPDDHHPAGDQDLIYR